MPPTNTTPETAQPLGSPPVSVSIDVTGLADETSLWFTFTVPAYGVVFHTSVALGGPFAFAETSVWTGTPGALEPWSAFTAWPDFSVQLPVTPLATYYLEAKIWLGTPPGPLVVTIEAGPAEAAPIGSLLINDEGTGFPAAALSQVDGTPLQFLAFPAGETQAMLRSGWSLWEDIETPTTLRLYDNTATFVASVPVPGRLAEGPIASNRVDRFYVAVESDAVGVDSQVVTVDLDGTVGAQTWDIPATRMTGIDVSPDETVLYYLAYTTSIGSLPISRWDLVGDVALSDLAAAVTDVKTLGIFGREVVVLPDGSILVPYVTVPPTTVPSFVRRYSPSGTILSTYDLGNVEVNRVTQDVGDEAGRFWVWSFPRTPAGFRDGYSRFDSIRVSDGVVLTSFTAAQFNGGVYAPATDPPDAAFGHSVSCPFVQIPFPLPAGGAPPDPPDPPDPAGGYGQRTVPQRRLRRAPHVAAEQRWLFYDRFALSLQTGIGVASGQGADPKVMVRWSNDGGHTWSREHWVSAGRMGDYTASVEVRRTGRARTRTFEVVVSDAVRWYLAAAFLDVTPGNGS